MEMISETMHNLFVVFVIFVVTKPQSNEALTAVQGSPCHFPTEVKIELTFQICATFVTI